MLDMASKFSPYRYADLEHNLPMTSKLILSSAARSLFMWYMWRIADVDVNVLQKT